MNYEIKKDYLNTLDTTSRIQNHHSLILGFLKKKIFLGLNFIHQYITYENALSLTFKPNGHKLLQCR